VIGKKKRRNSRQKAPVKSALLGVRWDNHPEFWRDVLTACRAADEQAISVIRRQGKLLFCGEFLLSINR